MSRIRSLLPSISRAALIDEIHFNFFSSEKELSDEIPGRRIFWSGFLYLAFLTLEVAPSVRMTRAGCNFPSHFFPFFKKFENHGIGFLKDLSFPNNKKQKSVRFLMDISAI